MNPAFIFSIGFLAQLCFSARMLLQWFKSESAGRVVSPAAFWWFSMGGALLMIVYGILRRDMVIVAGQLPLYYIYIRNLMLQKVWLQKFPKTSLLIILSPFLLIVGFGVVMTDFVAPILHNDAISSPLLVLGSMGTGLFSLRFLYQWIFSERSHNSMFPFEFWLTSIIGCVMLLIYGLLRNDPVIVIGQLFGSIVYIRNIVLLKRSNCTIKHNVQPL